MGTVRYFTCKRPEDMPSRDEWKAQIRAFQAMEGFAGPVRGETGIPGLRMDFNLGLRLVVPEGSWHVAISDYDTETVFFDDDVSDVQLVSMEKYYVHWSVEVSRDGIPVFSHVFDPAGQEVIFFCCHKALGDALAFLPYARLFRERHSCRLCCRVPGSLREFVAHLYPELPQVERATEDTYAVFYLGAWFSFMGMPVDLRAFPLAELAGTMVGLLGPAPMPSFAPTRPRPFPERYVCIAVQASTLSKGWHYPKGWETVVEYLKALGYRVFCIDRHAYQRELDYETQMPENAEDMTGNYSIMDRANMLYDADFFIGLSSGLAWVAKAVGCPVILISGMTQTWNEFHTPYRIVNRQVCNGCFNDVRVRFRDSFCPYHEGTERELECSKRISPRQVIAAIEELRKAGRNE